MNLLKLIKDYEKRFQPSGEFDLLPGELINIVVKQNKVPNERGVYIIYDNLKCSGNIIYIGKSGKIDQNGQWGDQGIKTRLTRKQDKKTPRQTFFQNIIKDGSLNGLSFKWFITFNDVNKILPVYAESELLQAFFDDKTLLPRWNKCC